MSTDQEILVLIKDSINEVKSDVRDLRKDVVIFTGRASKIEARCLWEESKFNDLTARVTEVETLQDKLEAVKVSASARIWTAVISFASGVVAVMVGYLSRAA